MLRRPAVLTAIVFGVFVFLGLSVLVARSLSGAGTERARVLDLVTAQARGDAEAVLAGLPACRREPACAEVTRERVRRLQRPGRVEILNFEPSVQFTLGDRVGSARVAWRADETLPVVQCVRVRREGPLRGGGAELLAISAPIARDGACE